MRKILIIALFIGILTSCSKNDRGELVGVKANKFFSDKPQGMVLIPSGSFTMGPSNPNVLLDQNPTLKTVSVKAFYMDETEITNSEYRQFVNWVRDSVVRTELAGLAYEKLGDGQTGWNELDQEDPLYEYYPIPEYIPSDDDEDAYMLYLENNDNGTKEVGSGEDYTFADELKELIANFGLEYWYTDSFVLRAGYIYDKEGKIMNPTFGAGIRFGQYGFDFGYTAGDQDHARANTMFFSVSMEL